MSLFLTLVVFPEKEFEALPDETKPRHISMKERRNISLRILNDFDCSTLQAKVKQLDGKGLIKGDYANP